MAVRRCSKCGGVKDGNHSSYCRACHAEYQRARYVWTPERREAGRRWLQNNRDHHNRRQNARRYGLTLEEYDRLLSCGVCDVCGSPGTKSKSLAVDHDKKTGKVRGVLCDPCNMALGLADHNPELLKGLAAYLEEHQPVFTAL